MAGPTSAQQGLDTIPTAIAKKYARLFEDFLPGWSKFGEYNFQPGVTNPKAGKQAGVLVQNGQHNWINDQLDRMMELR
jgi:hypothetical protein